MYLPNSQVKPVRYFERPSSAIKTRPNISTFNGHFTDTSHVYAANHLPLDSKQSAPLIPILPSSIRTPRLLLPRLTQPPLHMIRSLWLFHVILLWLWCLQCLFVIFLVSESNVSASRLVLI
jgi:hypothetical protein